MSAAKVDKVHIGIDVSAPMSQDLERGFGRADELLNFECVIDICVSNDHTSDFTILNDRVQTIALGGLLDFVEDLSIRTIDERSVPAMSYDELKKVPLRKAWWRPERCPPSRQTML